MICNTLRPATLTVLLFLTCSCAEEGKNKKVGGNANDLMNGSLSDSSFGRLRLPAGIPNLGPNEQRALETVNKELAASQPQSGLPDFSQGITNMMGDLERSQRAGADTTQLRYELMGKMLIECAEQVAQYAPNPGEPMLGQWAFHCNGSGITSNWTVNGRYPSTDAAGIPLGCPGLSYAGTVGGKVEGKPVSGSGGGPVSIAADGSGQAIGNWSAKYDGKFKSWQWTCPLTDQPSAAFGRCMANVIAKECSSADGKLTASRNPIQQKYQEGVKRLAACYRRAMTLTSPILWKYMHSMPEQSQQALRGALFIQ